MRARAAHALVRAACGVLLAAACARAPSGHAIPPLALAGVEAEVAEAIGAAHAALVADPRSGKAWGTLGDHYLAHNFSAEAAACYARAAELEPDHALWSYRGAWSLAADRPEDALAALERSLAYLDTYAPAHRLRGRLLARLGRDDDALAAFARAGALDAADPEAPTAIGLIHLARGDYEDAGRHLERALACDERHLEAHVGMAQVALALGHESRAQRHSERSRKLPQVQRELDPLASPPVPPLGARARTRLGQQLESERRFPEALAQYQAALRSDPDYYPARLRLAELLCALDRRTDALALLREAEAANPRFEAVRRDIAKLSRADEADPRGAEEE